MRVEIERGNAQMFKGNRFAARLLIGASVVAIALQNLVTLSCGCQATACCPSSGEMVRGCAAKQAACCCAARSVAGAEDGCCGARAKTANACQCGIQCRCRKPLQQPTAPPSQQRASEKPESTLLDRVDDSLVCHPPHQGACRVVGQAVAASGVAALDRCIALCRLTL